MKFAKKGNELPCDNDFDCPDFKEYKPKPYKEEFSECDCCQYVSSCGNIIESTTKYDMQRHFVKGIGGYCRKESGDFADKKLSEIIEIADKSNDSQLKNNGEFLQKAIERFGDITYKEFIKDKLYKMYHLWEGIMYHKQELSGKSLEFVKQRIDSGECGDMKNNHYLSMREVCFTDIANQKLNTDIVDRKSDGEWKLTLYAKSECGDKKQVNIEVQYNPDEDFNYFTVKSCRCDGTLIFYFELCEEILKRVFLGNTQYKPKLPEDYENEMDKYIIKYVVGDFVFTDEFGEEFATEDKPWMLSRFSVMLPIKCDFVKKADD